MSKGNWIKKKNINYINLYTITSIDVTCFLIATLALILAAVGGIGGSGILTLLYILFFHFTHKHSTPLFNQEIQWYGSYLDLPVGTLFLSFFGFSPNYMLLLWELV